MPIASVSYPHFNASVTSTAELVRSGSLRLETLEVQNPNTVQIFIQMFDAAAASSVTVGTTTPTLSFLCVAGDGVNTGGTVKDFPKGVMFRDGLVIAVTTTATGSTNPTSAATVNLTFA